MLGLAVLGNAQVSVPDCSTQLLVKTCTDEAGNATESAHSNATRADSTLKQHRGGNRVRCEAINKVAKQC